MYRGLSRLMLARRVGLLGPANGFRARGTQGRARSVLCRRSKSDGPAAEEKPPAEEGGGTNNNNGGSPPPKKGGGAGPGLALGAVGAAVIGGAVAYFLQQDPNSRKAIEEHNAAVANQGLPARRRLNQTSALQSILVNNQSSKLASCHGVSEILSCWLGANDPYEDRHSEHFLGDHGVLVGMYDGHSGSQTADALSAFLPSYVKRRLDTTKPKTVQETAQALGQAFEDFDHDLVDAIPKMALETKDQVMMEAFVNPAFTGAVACVALINATGIYVANTGDCRAVLGIERSSGAVGAAQLSNDQTAATPSEVARIREEHPDEERCVYRNRVLGGLQPSRAFGDSRYKWEAAQMEAVGVKPPKYSKTPPYVTATPEVLHTAVDKQTKFIILATDGVWDVVSSHEAVQVVGEALKRGSSALPAAAQLTRRALQKYAEESTEGDVDKLLEIKAPDARKYRDDITASVVILEPEAVVGEEGAGAQPDAKSLSIVSNLDKPNNMTLVDVFHRQARQRSAAKPK